MGQQGKTPPNTPSNQKGTVNQQMNQIKPLSQILLLLWIFSHTTFVHVNGATTTAPPFHPQTLRKYITSRCQNPLTPSSGIWSWEGRLVDPSNGNVIANVEGIELVRKLSEIERPAASSSSSDGEERTRSLWRVARGIRRLHDLKVKNMLTSEKDWDYAGTVLCRKLFCYSAPSGDSKGLLLKEYKHHPNAPVRKIAIDEAVALYDTATTFISREGGREMEVVTEWPDGRWVQSGVSTGLLVGGGGVGNDELDTDGSSSSRDDYSSKAARQKQQQKKFPFGFTAYVKRSGKGQIPSLPKKIQVSKRSGNSRSSQPSLPRSKFIQFGKDEDSENRRFGARETYSYMMGGTGEISRSTRYRRAGQEIVSNLGEKIGLWDFDFEQGNLKRGDDSSSCAVHYTRYGEAPPFYAPGKMCTLELLGRRISSVTDAPPLAATLAATRVPGFMSVHTPISFEDDTKSKRRKRKNKKRGDGSVNGLDQVKMAEQMVEDTAAINAVKWFRGDDGSLPLQIISDGDNDEQDLFTKVVNRGLNTIQRIRAATTLSADTEN